MKWLDKFWGGGLIERLLADPEGTVEELLQSEEGIALLQALLKKYPQLQEVVDKVTASKETGGVVEYFHALREGGKAMARKRQEKNSKIKPNAIKFAKLKELLAERGAKLPKDLLGKVKPNNRKAFKWAAGSKTLKCNCDTYLKREGGRIIEVDCNGNIIK